MLLIRRKISIEDKTIIEKKANLRLKKILLKIKKIKKIYLDDCDLIGEML